MLALLVGAAALPAVAAAQEQASPPGIGFSEKRAKAGGEQPAEGGKRWGDGRTSRGPQPIAEPARGRPYNLTHVVYASLIMLAMLGLVIWLVRRNRQK